MNSPSYFMLEFGRLGEAELFIKIHLASILSVSVAGIVFKDYAILASTHMYLQLSESPLVSLALHFHLQLCIVPLSH